MIKLNIKIFILLLIPIFALTISFFHEFWTDEGIIGISIVELTLAELLDYFRYIGYFPLQSFLIKIIFLITENIIFSTKFITIFFYFLSCLLIVNREIPTPVKLLVLLSYPLLAEYAVINRHYIFIATSIFYLTLYSKKSTNLTILSLIVLNGSGLLGLLVSFSYKLQNHKLFFKLIRDKNLFLIFYILFTIVCIYYLFPFDISAGGGGIEFQKFKWQREFSLTDFRKILEVFFQLILSINYLIDISYIDSIWSSFNSSYLIKFFFIIFGFFELIIFLFILYKVEKKYFLFVFFFLIFFFICFSIQPRGDYRVYFIFTIIFIALSIRIIYLNKNNTYLFLRKIYKKIFLSSLIILNISSINFVFKEIFFDFSQGKNVANFIKNRGIKCNNITSYPPSASNSWIVYLDKNCAPYQFGLEEYSSLHRDLSKGHNWEYNNDNLFKAPKTEFIIYRCGFYGKKIDACKKDLEFFQKTKFYKWSNEVYIFNTQTLNGYEKYIIFEIKKQK